MQSDTMKLPAHFDATIMSGLMVNNKEQLNEMFAMIIKELNKSVAILETNVCNNELQNLKAEGHKLYGTTLIAGLPCLGSLAQQFEHLQYISEKEAGLLVLQTKEEVQLVNQLIGNYIQQA
ncbi:HPt (histidine-containing phosphotransfer) domain-containing protein [Filimonas lacunae]|uniref:HPt (Histidine-containing phosphotransfer) domain-containing protein n=1 Tax=Filimonas lacunae TaxID=477680 RepID=A0A173ME36_9BACT|nr:Hpt domain-containing protein [Filimonas lacunae]BAV05835.1 hypothetical protein FLA_1847 [Filimonas lacunae]SIT28433.1 HPt (histidine-containing phosphotransfer) domain-containing protein [Filimonas lacunae]